ncbi:MAG: cyclomaltodextrinase N-terminal domain-containing protein [Acidobacteriaceae bacterium]|nr:cyclomaltodextrinase N-terminal domain-containing protein [Acidobacteriaceae bacterium]
MRVGIHFNFAQPGFLFALLGIGVAYAAPSVTKVEPPNWWTGHTLNPVRLLIRGTGLTATTVTPARGIAADQVSVNPSGTYLFVNVTIPPETKPGDYPLQLKTADGTVTAPFRIDAPLEPSGRFQGFSPDDVIYLIMPDRFANGDTSNDDPAISHGLFDRKNSHFYHGGDLQGIINHLPYLKELGVTALWLTPIYDNNNRFGTNAFQPSQIVSDYHGYGAVDYYGVEEHFGDLKLLRTLVDEAHRAGIKVIQDQVANHVGPAHPWVSDPPTATWFHGTAAHHLNETFNLWNLINPHASDELIRPVLDGWFADSLPDLNQEDPQVAKYEIQNALWWIGVAGFDGIRQDTLPYVSRRFWAEWSAALKRQYPALQVVGEVLDSNPAITSFFQAGTKDSTGTDTGIDTVFDYPVYFSIRDAFTRERKLESLIKMMANDGLYPDPAKLVTIFGDHDVQRFMNEPGATVDSLKLALAFVLTARGTPVIYYGDEIGMLGGEDPDNRHDFPGGWAGDPHNAFEKGGRTPQEAAVFDFTRKLTALRARLEPLRRGRMVSLAEGPQTWVYARQSSAGTAIVAFNNGDKPADMAVHLEGVEKTFHPSLDTKNDLPFHNGTATIHLPAVTAEVYTLADERQQ